MNVFEYLVFKKEERDTHGKVTSPATVIVDRKTILAKSEEQVRVIAAREIPDEHMDKLDLIVVAVRPF